MVAELIAAESMVADLSSDPSSMHQPSSMHTHNNNSTYKVWMQPSSGTIDRDRSNTAAEMLVEYRMVTGDGQINTQIAGR